MPTKDLKRKATVALADENQEKVTPAKKSKTMEGGTEYRKFRTDGPLKCTWYPGTKEMNPHVTIPRLDLLFLIIGQMNIYILYHETYTYI